MTTTQLMEAIGFYRKALKQAAAVPVKLGHVNDKNAKLDHVMWMCDEVESFTTELVKEAHEVGEIDTRKLEKIMRWFGFIQASMWWSGLYTIEEMKAHNR